MPVRVDARADGEVLRAKCCMGQDVAGNALCGRTSNDRRAPPKPDLPWTFAQESLGVV